MADISVILPVYNAADTVADTINSILGQTYGNFELIILDDGSTDDSLNIIKSYSDPRIRLVCNKENLGLVNTLNKALTLSTCRYVARMDADDLMHPKRLEIQYQFMEEHRDIAICGTFLSLLNVNENVGYIQHGQSYDEIKAELLFNSPIAHPTFMVRREVYSKYQYDGNYKYCEDYEFLSRVLREYRAANLPLFLLDYRLSGDRLSVKGEGRVDERFEKISAIHQCLLSEGLGLKDDEAYLKLHYDLCLSSNISKMGISPGITIRQISSYFNLLLRRNIRRGYCKNAALQEVLGKIWLKIFKLRYKSLIAKDIRRLLLSKYFLFGIKFSIKYSIRALNRRC